MSDLKEYLGDSVYADFDGFGIVLTTENGYEPRNTIVLEPQVLKALERYQQKLRDHFDALESSTSCVQPPTDASAIIPPQDASSTP